MLCFSHSPGLLGAFKMVDLPKDYQIKLFWLAMCNACLSLCYERFCVPHVSQDEEPVQEVPKSGENPLDTMEKIERTCGIIDQQPTILPKLRARPPTYHQIMTSWKRKPMREANA